MLGRVAHEVQSVVVAISADHAEQLVDGSDQPWHSTWSTLAVTALQQSQDAAVQLSSCLCFPLQ